MSQMFALDHIKSLINKLICLNRCCKKCTSFIKVNELQHFLMKAVLVNKVKIEGGILKVSFTYLRLI